jgi:hypothetical protein
VEFMTALDDIPRRWGIVSLAALAALAALPPWLCIGPGHVDWTIVAAGALIWAVSVAAKRPLVWLLYGALARPESRAVKAGLHGLLSAAVELGAAALYLGFWTQASLIEIVGFGVGAGSAEVVYILALAIFGPQPDPEEVARWARGAAVSLCVRYTVPIERLFALIGHTGSRGLIYFGLHSSPAVGAIWLGIALLLFAATDGVAARGHGQGWKWNDPPVCRRVHSFFASVSLAEVAIFLLAFRLSV